MDWQIWIAQGDRPYPCQYVITSPKVKGSPQYTVDVRDWKTGAEVASDSFSLTVPPRVQRNSSQAMFRTLMSYPLCSRKKEHNDHVEAHQGLSYWSRSVARLALGSASNSQFPACMGSSQVPRP